MAFQDYSTDPASNTSIGDSIYIGPNMARNDVREALQTLAADGAELYNEMQTILGGLGLEGMGIYRTKAAATADLANIDADTFAQVLVDESRASEHTIYQKVAGVLDYVVSIPSLASTFILQSSGAHDGYLWNANSLWVGNTTDTPSDNAVVVAGHNYSDAAPLTNSIHTFVTVGTASFTAAGESGNDYDTKRIYEGTGVWDHHNHFQTRTTFTGNVQFNTVFGMAGQVTFSGNAVVDDFVYVDFTEAVPEDAAVVGRNLMLRYLNSHFSTDMTNILTANRNYVLEVRRYLTDPVTDFAASMLTEGMFTAKAIVASDTEEGPYNADGTLNGNIERFNCLVASGSNGYFKFNNGHNTWLVGQPAGSINYRIRTTAGTASGLDINNVGVHSLNTTTLSAWGGTPFGFQLDKTSVASLGSADLNVSSNAYHDGTNWKRIAAAAASRISLVGNAISLFTAASSTADSTISWGNLTNAVDDAAAAAAGVAVNQLYRNGSVVMIRVA